MYQVGDLVIYGGKGVCRVEAVGRLTMAGVDREQEYYTLTPLYRNGKIYTPVDNGVFMRPILSRKEAEELVRTIPKIQPTICKERNPRLLEEFYQEQLRSYSCDSMVRVIKSAYGKNQARRAQGLKPGQVDERYMRRAEELLYGELAAALEMDRDQVRGYISEVAEQSAKA